MTYAILGPKIETSPEKFVAISIDFSPKKMAVKANTIVPQTPVSMIALDLIAKPMAVSTKNVFVTAHWLVISHLYKLSIWNVVE